MTTAQPEPAAQSRNLVVLRSGDSSLHEQWLTPERDRNFALGLSYYGDHPERWVGAADRLVGQKGPKWVPLADFVDQNWDWVSQFDYVAFPDDDLGATASDWNKLFSAVREFDLDLAQPSLDYDSYWTHQITARRPAYRVRFTNFVEVMAPVFSRFALERCLPTFRMSPSGFGLDLVWPAILGRAGRRLGIVDEVSFGHTRPFRGDSVFDPAASGGSGVYATLAGPPFVDNIIMTQIFDVSAPFDPITYSAVPA
jgi:hypothetical protein